MIQCSTSLWSADLCNLRSEIRRVEPYSDRFHLDVADGVYTESLLFFPDLVSAIRRCTNLPLEIHLMVKEPKSWVTAFSQAGADIIGFCVEGIQDPLEVIHKIHRLGKKAGVCLKVEDEIEAFKESISVADVITLMGTPIGVKGATMAPIVLARLETLKRFLSALPGTKEIVVDGGIRRDTVPKLVQGGADFIVPGSLMFAENPAEVRKWLATL